MTIETIGTGCPPRLQSTGCLSPVTGSDILELLLKSICHDCLRQPAQTVSKRGLHIDGFTHVFPISYATQRKVLSRLLS